jgi:hypothetical protein
MESASNRGGAPDFVILSEAKNLSCFAHEFREILRFAQNDRIFSRWKTR